MPTELSYEHEVLVLERLHMEEKSQILFCKRIHGEAMTGGWAGWEAWGL